MEVLDLIFSFINNIKSILDPSLLNLIFKTISYTFLLGFLVFLILYFKSLKNNLTTWKEMDSFDKIIFILLLGLIHIFIITTISFFIFLVGMIVYEVLAPYICGQMIGYFKFIFVGTVFFYFIYLIEKFKVQRLNCPEIWKETNRLCSSRFFRYIFVLDFVLPIFIVVFGLITNSCITFR